MKKRDDREGKEGTGEGGWCGGVWENEVLNNLTFDFQRHLVSSQKPLIAIMTESKNW